jgi:hypothetical protein
MSMKSVSIALVTVQALGCTPHIDIAEIAADRLKTG